MSQNTQDYAPPTQPYGVELDRIEREYRSIINDIRNRNLGRQRQFFSPVWEERFRQHFRYYNYRELRRFIDQYRNAEYWERRRNAVQYLNMGRRP